MSASSAGWRTVRFDRIAHNIAERVEPAQADTDIYVGLEHLDPDSLRLNRWGTPSDVEGTKLRFYPGDIIFGRRRAYQRKLAVAEFEGICSAHAMVLRAKPDVCLPEFLPFFLQSDRFFERAMAISVGSLSPTINWKTLAVQEFPLPPLNEQRRITEILWAAEEAISCDEAVLSSAQKLRASLLEKWFDPSSSVLEEGVNLRPLSQVLQYVSDGPFGSKLKTEHYATDGARVVRLQNIGNGAFLDEDKAYISHEYYSEMARYALRPGDVIVAGLGDETHPVGRACQVPRDLGPAINKADCFCLRSDTSMVGLDYLLHFLNSPFAQMQVQQKAQGTTRLRVNVANLKTIHIPVLSLERQAAICQTLAQVEAVLQSAGSKAEQSRNLALKLRERLLRADRD